MAAVITLSIMGLLFGLGLAYSAEIFKVEIDQRVEDVDELLPGFNCGACGYPGCNGFAEAIVAGEVDKLSQCKPGKDEHYDPIIAYLEDHPNKDGSTINIKK
ncbi:MAG: RnfABCDGE type electron transport complex subunit B [Candidatus Izimaplasma sp.]|nr:RnfABCDGE type electron transport complex subunit B [Candidatus Izimaplasma bacterium]